MAPQIRLVCPHCDNDDPKMFDLWPNILWRGQIQTVALCLVCTKEHPVPALTRNV